VLSYPRYRCCSLPGNRRGAINCKCERLSSHQFAAGRVVIDSTATDPSLQVGTNGLLGRQSLRLPSPASIAPLFDQLLTLFDCSSLQH